MFSNFAQWFFDVNFTELLSEIKGLETSYQTPDDFIQTALKLKPQLQMTSNFAERKFHICRTHVLNSKLQVFIDLKLCRIKYFTERVW